MSKLQEMSREQVQARPIIQNYIETNKVETGVISRGAQREGAPYAKSTDHFGGLSPTPHFCICFSKCIDFAFKVFCIAMVNFALLHDY